MIRYTIETQDEPAVVTVTGHGEPDHRKVIASGESYTFEVPIIAAVNVEHIDPRDVSGDDTNQRGTPDNKPHAGQTSATSSLQPEPADITARRDASEGWSDQGGNATQGAVSDTTSPLPVDRDIGGLYNDTSTRSGSKDERGDATSSGSAESTDKGSNA